MSEPLRGSENDESRSICEINFEGSGCGMWNFQKFNECQNDPISRLLPSVPIKIIQKASQSRPFTTSQQSYKKPA